MAFPSEAVDEVIRPTPQDAKHWQMYWEREKTHSDDRLKEFIAVGNDVVQRYVAEEADRNDSALPDAKLNLFHKSVKTTLDMLYGRRPQVSVDREHKDPDDDPARVAAYLLKRILDAGCKSPVTLRSVLQDRLLPGLGVARVRYDVETTEMPYIGPDGAETKQTVIANEEALTEYVHWQDFRWGWARTWEEVPWVGFRAWMPKEKVKKRFGKKIAENLQYKAKSPTGDPDKVSDSDENSDQVSHTHEAEIWEFWHKADRKVFWWSPGAALILDMKDDPLGLKYFWPCPRPLAANVTTSMYLPTADFVLAEDLYNEIDILQTRISVLTEAIKMVGVYDESAGASVGRMLKEGKENELIPVPNWAMFAEGGGLQAKTEWFPVEQVAMVVDKLTAVQNNKIQQLYEITGLSTLLRGGDTPQYTSDGTNKMTAKFGSVAIQALQDEFAQFASDLQALKAEVIAKHYLPRSIFTQANAQYIPRADQPLIEPAIQLLKSPQLEWRIEISPESLAMVDYAQLQSERVNYITATSTFLQSSQAMLKQVPTAGPFLLEILKFGLAGFKGGEYLEGIIDQAIEDMQKNPPQGEDNSQGEMAKEQMSHKNKLRENEQKFGHSMQLEQMKSGNSLQQENVDHTNKVELEQIQHMNTMREMMAQFQDDMKKIASDLRADLQRERMQSTMAIAEEDVRHKNTMTEQRNASVQTGSE